MNMLNRPASLLSNVAAFLLVMVAFVGCKSDSDSTSSASGVITVTGKVIDASSQPIPNTPVVVSGRPATTTDANGNFTVTGVATPYDVTAIFSATKMAITYKGITRTDPVIYFTGAALTTPNSATVSGTVSGGAGYPLPANHTSRVMFVSPEVFRSSSPSGTTGAYTLNPAWIGAATITGTLHALQWETNASGLPLTYKGYGTKANVALTGGGTFGAQNVTLAAATGSTVSGTVTVPAGLTLNSKTIELSFNRLGSTSLGSDLTASTSFSFNVPAITGATIILSGFGSSASLGNTSTVLRTTPGLSNVPLVLVTPPQPSLPVDAATGVTTASPFSWTPVPGGVYVLSLNGPAGEPDYFVVTTSPTGQVPDLSAQGLGLGAGKTYTWSILSFGPLADMNAATGPDGLVGVLTVEGWRAFSGNRTFTTAP